MKLRIGSCEDPLFLQVALDCLDRAREAFTLLVGQSTGNRVRRVR
jgi:hypothetical protein